MRHRRSPDVPQVFGRHPGGGRKSRGLGLLVVFAGLLMLSGVAGTTAWATPGTTAPASRAEPGPDAPGLPALPGAPGLPGLPRPGSEPAPTNSPSPSAPPSGSPSQAPSGPADEPAEGRPDEGEPEGESGESVVCNLPVSATMCDLWGGVKTPLSFASDPFGYIATMVQKAIGSVLKLFAQLVDETSGVDWGNEGFLRTYTMMFGLATFVTAFLWLIAVGKRVVAGAGPAEAIGESIGYLLIAVVVSAFAPAAVALVTDLVDEASAAMFRPVLGDVTDLEDTLAQVWTVMLAMGGGGFLASMLGSFLLFAVVSVWAELVVRSALLYVSLVFGPLVFSGLVDRALWRHTKRWLGATVAVIMSKPVTLTVLALATGILREFEVSQTVTDPLTALQILFVVMALFFLAFLLPVAIGRFVPAFGDELATIAAARSDAAERIRGAGSRAKEGADDMASTTDGRLDAASEMVQKGIDKVGGGAMKPTVDDGGKDGEGDGVPAPDGVEGTAKAGEGAGAAEAGALDAAGPVGAGAGAAKRTLDEVKEFLGGAAESGAERATGEDAGRSGGSGNGRPAEAPPPPEEPPPPTPDTPDGQG